MHHTPLCRKIICLPLLFWFTLIVKAQPAPDTPYSFAHFIEQDFPFITTTLNASTLGDMYPEHNVAVRCLMLVLEHDAYACFDMDLLRVAATWTGEGISMLAMPHVSYHQAGNKKNGIPEILGEPITATGIYPGWQGEVVSFDDPRPAGPNPTEAGRGPVSPKIGSWKGVSVHGKHAVLRYKVKETNIAENISSAKIDDQTVIIRSIELQPHADTLSLILGEFKKGAGTVDNNKIHIRWPNNKRTTSITLGNLSASANLVYAESHHALLQIPPSTEIQKIYVGLWNSSLDRNDVPDNFMASFQKEMPALSENHPPRWGAPEATQGQLGGVQNAFAVDKLTLPLPNRWQRNVRVAGLDFFDDGRAAVSTYDGDVWLVTGIDASLDNLSWKRFASGLSEPMSLAVVQEEVYVFGREGIVHLQDLNNDGEADYYQNFSNVPVQTGESREFPLSMHALPEGGFLIAKNAALNAGPKTNPQIMNGFRAGGPHSGSVLKVSPDGKQVTTVATGLRGPYTSITPDGLITASDQQGHSVPSTPIYHVQQGDYFGVPATAHTTIVPEETKPITWIPHQVDRSGTEQVRISSNQMGPLNESLVHLSYGKPGIYKVYFDQAAGQGGITPLPFLFNVPLMKGQINPQDGSLYLAGFQIWDSDATQVSGLSRVRYVGGTLPIPLQFQAGLQGVLLEFDQPLDAASVKETANYTLERWNYQRTDKYGSGHFKPSGEPGREAMSISAGFLDTTQQRIFLAISDMQEVMQMGLHYRLTTQNGDSLNNAVHFTINSLPLLDLASHGFEVINLATISTATTPTSNPVEVPQSAPRGKVLFEQTGCAACHSLDGSTAGKSGPTFLGLFGRERSFVDGTSAIADASYLEESILHPDARVIAGKEVEMPSYLGVLSNEDIASIILFIQTLEE